MMKNRTIALLTIGTMLLTTIILHNATQNRKQRHYQHLEAQIKTECTQHSSDVFCTHLPLIKITTDSPIPDPYFRNPSGSVKLSENGRPIFNTETVSAAIEVFDSATENNHLYDVPVLSEKALIRARGNSSRRFDKKSYLLKFKQNDMIENKDVSLVGMTADSTWVLHGPFMDRTLIRNYICCHLAGEVMDFSPDVRFCELFANDEYLGVYLIMEKINYNQNGRVNLSKTNPKLSNTSYLLKLDHGSENAEAELNTFFDFSRKRGLMDRGTEKLEILYPGKTLTDKQKEKIRYELSCFEKAITSYDREDSQKGYNAYIDVDSFVDYMVLNEFFMNSDAGNLSTFLCKDMRGKIKIIGWDYNNTFNNFVNDHSSPHFISADDTLYNYLLQNKSFVDRVVARYHELRKNTLSDENVLKLVDDTISYLGPAIDRNYDKWGYCFKPMYEYASANKKLELGLVKPFSRNPSNYEESVQLLRQCIVEHGKFLDENIETLYARCHDSTHKQFKAQGGR